MPLRNDRYLPALPRLAAAPLLITFAAGLLLPIYTDEVGWRAQLSRSPFDGGVDRALADQCGPNTTLRAPWFMQPMRHLTAWIEAAIADPRSVRVIGIALAVAFVWLLAAIARRAAGDPAQGRAGVALALAMLGLGTTPLLLIWSRPEQPLLLALGLAILLVLGAPAGAVQARWRAGAILLLAVVALGFHPKGVVFAPVLIVAAACAGRGRDALGTRLSVALAIALLAGEAFRYWNTRFACPGDAGIAAHHAAENVSVAGVAGGSWLPLLRVLADNVSPMGYVLQVRPGGPQMAQWLPPSAWSPRFVIGWYAVIDMLWQFAMLAVAGGIVLAGIAAWRRRRLDRRLALALAIAGTTLAWSALQTNKNAYEAALILPLIAIALLLVLPALAARWPRLPAPTAAGAVLLAVASQALLLAEYLPSLMRAAATPGTIRDQPYSFTAWGYPALRREILAAGRRCGIVPQSARYLLVDDLTYWPYLRSWRPLLRMSVLESWISSSADPIGYLRAHGSSGIVTQCAILPPPLRAQAKAAGQFCCIGLLGGAGR